MGEKVQGFRSTNWYVQNRQEKVKNSIGNKEAKEFVCMTHQHELRGRIARGNGGTRWRGGKGRKVGATVIA